MDHAHHAAFDFGMIACYLVSWSLAALTAWHWHGARFQECGDHRRCLLACFLKFAMMPPAMSLFGWWGMALSAAIAGVVMFWPMIRRGKKS